MLAPIKQSEPQRSYQSCLGYRAMINILEVMDLQVPPVAGAAHTLGGCSPIVKATDRWSWHHVGSNVASRPVPRAVWSHCEWVGGHKHPCWGTSTSPSPMTSFPYWAL